MHNFADSSFSRIIIPILIPPNIWRDSPHLNWLFLTITLREKSSIRSHWIRMFTPYRHNQYSGHDISACTLDHPQTHRQQHLHFFSNKFYYSIPRKCSTYFSRRNFRSFDIVVFPFARKWTVVDSLRLSQISRWEWKFSKNYASLDLGDASFCKNFIKIFICT